jgi:hypothetical protein
MTDYDRNRPNRPPDSRRTWTWILGILALVVVVGFVVYSLGSHRDRAAIAAGDAKSPATAQTPAPAAPGGLGRR